MPGLADAAARVTPIGLLLADAEFDTEANHQHIRQRLGARSIILAKRGRSSRVGIRGQMRRHFPRRIYAQRAKVEKIFSIIKRKLSARAPGRSLPTQTRQALLLGLTFNFYRLRHPFVPRGCQQSHFRFEISEKRKTRTRIDWTCRAALIFAIVEAVSVVGCRQGRQRYDCFL